MPGSDSSPLTLRRTWAFFWPLALSGVMMSAGQPVVQAGLARLESAELVLSAYGVAFYVAVLLEAPIIMLLPAATALVRDEESYRFTRNTMVVINVILTALTAAVALWRPLYDVVFLRLLGFPADVASAAQPGLIALIPWPALVGVRRYCQGILIRYGRTAVVSWGSAARLAAMIGVLWAGVAIAPGHGVLVGGLSLAAGVLADMIVATVAARKLLLAHVLPQHAEDGRHAGRTVVAFLAFFAPLAATSALRVVGRPLMLSGIAKTHEPVLALAAFPVALGTLNLFSGFLQMIQQVAVALIRDGQSFAVVRRFTGLLAGGSTALVAAMAWTPLGHLYHGSVIGLEGPVLAMAGESVGLMVLAPMLTAFQCYLQGLMIQRGRTVAVNAAALGNLILLVGAINAGATLTKWSGHLIAGAAYPLALLAEVAILYYWCRPVERELAAEARLTAEGRASASMG